MSTKAERECVTRILGLSPQSRASVLAVGGWDPEKLQDTFGEPHTPGAEALSEALDDLVTDDKVEMYEDGEDAVGNPILMYRLSYEEYKRLKGESE